MANTLTNLIPPLYEALDIVSRELVGFIPAVFRDSNAERAALNQAVVVPITVEEEAADNQPAVTPPDTGDNEVDNVEIRITKSRHVPVRFNGEEIRGLETGAGYGNIIRDRFAQAMRTLTNEIERDIALEAYRNASRAYGTPGTAPFGVAGNLTDLAGTRRILEENGAPLSDLQIVLNHDAIFNMRGVQNLLFRVNESGREDMLRDGMTDRLQGFAIRHSGQFATHVKGTGAGYQTNGVQTAGARNVAVQSGTGTIIAGDVLTFASDPSNKYVVNAPLTAGALQIGGPGLRSEVPSGNAVSLANNYMPNVGFARSAIVLATRAPALPVGGDMASDMITATDPVSGLSFEVAEYKQFLQTSFHVRIAWGTRAIKSEHIALLLG